MVPTIVLYLLGQSLNWMNSFYPFPRNKDRQIDDDIDDGGGSSNCCYRMVPKLMVLLLLLLLRWLWLPRLWLLSMTMVIIGYAVVVSMLPVIG